MDKRTILAIFLCGLVMVGSVFVETAFIAPKQRAAAEAQAQKQAEEEKKQQEAAAEVDSLISTAPESDSSSEESKEEFFTIKTNKAEVKFTNKGGDIVSYRLIQHLDKDTGYGVEMVDNVTDKNRAFSLTLGDYTNSVLNDVFKVKQIDDYTIGFYRDYYVEGKKYQISKLYSFNPDDYVFKLDVGIDGGSNVLNMNGSAYSLRTSPQIGPHYDRKKNRYEVRQYLSLNGNKRMRKPLDEKVYDKAYSWGGVAGKYFTMLVNPKDAGTMSSKVVTTTRSESDYMNSQAFFTRLATSSPKTVDSYYIYVGPRKESDLIAYNSADKNAWGLTNVKFNQALQTGGFLSIIEIALKWCMEFINRFVKNWGVSIIILTVLLKIVLFPLNKKSAEGTVKMQALQPQIQALQDKYGDNKEKLNEEMQKVYKEAGYNPASGCLPMILQMLILLALYNVFNNYFEFRGASFIPGWIDDLSAGDKILSWDKEIFLVSNFTQNTLRILPFIYLASQLLNGVITQNGGASAGQSQGQMAFMMYGMPILFFFMFYNVPSGLLLYWTVSNILQIGQQLVINRITKKKLEEAKKNQKPVNKNEAKFKGGKKKTR